MDYDAMMRALEAILFAAGEPVKLSRLSGLLAAPEETVRAFAEMPKEK